ncbi:uncharacterized protein LOC121263563 [Juglans microcarpa x Juglans regia]|uniref:uncharacterized protein LOC121263563 n=1 Tax=Juglans microcarpa x Juglans regia TaxID=2249226 RepID=UPI001B7EE3A3|nr:uncharacterized protein LOC121263563 [Juglans microcarpa x Juglans regia]
MGRESWLGLGGRLKKAVKKLAFVLSFKLRRWRLASIVGCAFTRRRLSFNDRVGLHGCIEDDQGEKSDGNSSFRGVQRAKSFAYSDDDVDRRADIFIANFRRQLRFERQISLELRYCNGRSFKGDEDNRSF